MRMVRLVGATGAVCVIAGCRSPFSISSSDFAAVPEARIRELRGLDLASYETEPDTADTEITEPGTRLMQGVRSEVGIADVRAAALENSLDIRVARLSPEIARQTVNEESARFDTVFRIDATYSETDTPTSSTLNSAEANSQFVTPRLIKPLLTGGTVDVSLPTSRTSTNNTFTTLNPAYDSDLAISLTQPLLRGAGRENATAALRLAGLAGSISEVRARAAVASTLTSADRSYWELWAARRQLDLRIEEFNVAKEVLEQARRLVRAGAVAEVEIVRAESGVSDRVSTLLGLEQLVLQRQRELKRAMHSGSLVEIDDTIIVPTTDPTPVPLEIDSSAMLSVAMATRPELLELELELLADATRIASAENSALPQLDLTATYRRNGLGADLDAAAGQIYQDEFEDYAISVAASIPIGNEAAEARVRRASLTRLSRIMSREARSQTIEQDVLDAIERVRSDWQRIVASRQSVTLNTRTLTVEQRQFEQGLSTSVDVLEAAGRLASARASEIRSIADYEIARVALAEATGTVLGLATVSFDEAAPAEK